jgi:hypothetical protein
MIEIVSVSNAKDGRQRATVLIGRSTSAILRRLGARQKNVLKRFLSAGLRDFRNQHSARIVARIPTTAVHELDAVCKKEHSSKSRVLLARVQRYVDKSGKLTGQTQAKVSSIIFDDKDWEELGQIQVVAPKKQVEGFNEFCHKVGIKKNAFFVREIEAIQRELKEGMPKTT